MPAPISILDRTELRTEPIRILHCIETIASGGVERRRLALVQGLDSSRYEHRIICSRASGPVADGLRQSGVAITEVGSVQSIFDIDRYKVGLRIAEEWRPHIVHGAIIEGYTLAGVVGRLKGVPAIMEETSDPQNRRWKGHILARIAASLAHQCVGVSPAVGRYLTGTLRIPDRKVAVINNGVPKPTATQPEELETLRTGLGLKDTDIVVGSVGRLYDDHKRFSDLIAAVEKLSDIPNIKLLIVGDGPDDTSLRALADEYGIADRVVFAGFQAQVGYYYALMSVFALASSREAFGLVVAEAMRAGLPVVATRVGGIPDVVNDRTTGLLVPPYAPEALAGALRLLVGDTALRQRLGNAGRERADRLFSAERYVAEVGDMYERIASEVSGR